MNSQSENLFDSIIAPLRDWVVEDNRSGKTLYYEQFTQRDVEKLYDFLAQAINSLAIEPDSEIDRIATRHYLNRQLKSRMINSLNMDFTSKRQLVAEPGSVLMITNHDNVTGFTMLGESRRVHGILSDIEVVKTPEFVYLANPEAYHNTFLEESIVQLELVNLQMELSASDPSGTGILDFEEGYEAYLYLLNPGANFKQLILP